MHTLGIVIVVAWAMALVTTILNLLLIPRLRAAGRAPASRVSVVIPARDEERGVEATVRAMLAQTGVDLEVIVVDDRSTDATPAILASISDPRLVVVRGEEPSAGWLGKPWAIQQGSRHATGELLLIVDADVVYAPGTVAAAAAYLEEHSVSVVSLLPYFDMRGIGENAGLSQLALAAFTVVHTWLANRTLLPVLGIGGGPGTLVRRADFEAAGGYAVVRDAVVDDVGFVRQMRARGHRSHCVLADDFVTLRMYHGLREVVHGFTKNIFSALGRSYAATALLVAVMLVFHILPFVTAAAGDPLGIAAVALIIASRLLLFGRLGYPLVYAVTLHPVTTVIWIWIALRSMWVTGVRRQLHWRGRKMDDWSHFG